NLEISPEPLLSFLFLVFVVTELVKLSRPMRDIGLELTGIFEKVHGKEFLPEIAPVQLDVEDGLIKILQFPKGEFLGQQAKPKGMFLYPFLQPSVAYVQDLAVIEGHIR